jgi:hypothetical protein
MTRDKGLRRELSEDELAQEIKGVDESLAEGLTVHRRPLSERAKGASLHQPGDEEYTEADREREKFPEQEDPPQKYEASEGAE